MCKNPGFIYDIMMVLQATLGLGIDYGLWGEAPRLTHGSSSLYIKHLPLSVLILTIHLEKFAVPFSTFIKL